MTDADAGEVGEACGLPPRSLLLSLLLRSARCFPAFLILTTVLILIPCAFIFSDQTPSGNASSTVTDFPDRFSRQTYRVSVDLVNVLCSVFDKDTNSFVTSLSREDFELYEDGQKQEIENFTRETDLPTSIAGRTPISNSNGDRYICPSVMEIRLVGI